MKKYHWLILGIITLASLAAEFTLHHHSSEHYWFTDIPLFWILFGLLGCFILIIFAKRVIAPVLYKKEDYYE
jgi:lipid-A-disaccharide synthase-like uncharacterized protein